MKLSRHPDLVEAFLKSSLELGYPVDLGLKELSDLAANLMFYAVPDIGFTMAKLLLFHGFGSLVPQVLGPELGRAGLALHTASFGAMLSTLESNKATRQLSYLSWPVIITPSELNAVQLGFVEKFGDQVVNILDKCMTPHNLAGYDADGLRGLFIVLLSTIPALILSSLHSGKSGLEDGKRDTCHPAESSACKNSTLHLDRTLRLLCHYLILIGTRLGLLKREIDIDNLVLITKARFCEFSFWHNPIMNPYKLVDPTAGSSEDSELDPDLPSRAMGNDIFNIPQCELLHQWSFGEHVNEEEQSDARTPIKQRHEQDGDCVDNLTDRAKFLDTGAMATARQGCISHLSDDITMREDHKGEARRRAPLPREPELNKVKRIQVLVVITLIRKLGQRIRALVEMDMKPGRLEGFFDGGELKAHLSEVAGDLKQILAESAIGLEQPLTEISGEN